MSIAGEIDRLNSAKNDLQVFLTANGVPLASANLNQMVNALGNLPKWTVGDGLELSEEGVLSLKESATPHIGENGNWYVGTTDTGVAAQGEDGKDGAQGPQGEPGKDGSTPYIGANGHWFIGTTDTGVAAQGPEGPAGTGSDMDAVLAKMYPVGTIYLSYQETNPRDLFGGTWVAIDQGRFLRSAGSYNIVGKTGGADMHQHGLGTALSVKSRPYSGGFSPEKSFVVQEETSVTSVADSNPPYINVYMWRRIA